MGDYLLIFCAGFVAGALNAAAGGGSFITFPALVYAGVSPIQANASSTVALFPASLTSAWEFRKYIQPFSGVSLASMMILTFLGGGVGALLLLFTTSDSFNNLVPWLLLIGSLAFAFGKHVGSWLRKRIHIGPWLVLFCQFLLGIYGGYFGGAVGIMMMSVWALFGLSDIKVINANKTLFVGVANAIAIIMFIVAGKVSWLPTSVMLVATIAGGYLGAFYTKRIDPVKLRKGIIVFNFLITTVFFVRAYLL